MDRRRFVAFAAMLVVIVGAAVLTQVTITPAPAQEMGKPKMVGSIVEKTIQDLGSNNLPGVKTVKYMRLTMKPGARMENVPMNDGTDLCEAKRGTITVTFPDGSKMTKKAGDVFVVPVGTKTKLITVSGTQGYDEFFWRIVPAK